MPKERSKLPSRGTSGRVGGIVSGQFTLFGLPRGAGSAGPLDTASGSFDFKWEDGVIDLEGVSDDPQTDIDVTTEAEFAWQPAINEFRITNGVLKKAKLTANYSGEVQDVPLDTTFVFRAAVEEMDCQDFFRAFPRALFGPYKRAKIEGEEFAPSVYFKLPIYRPRALRLAFEDYEDICEIKELNVKKKFWPEMTIKAVAPTGPHKSVNGFPDDYDPTTRGDVYWLNRPFVKKVHDEGVSDPENVTIYVGPGTADYVPLDEMPSYVGGAMYLSEQMLFYKNPAISISLIKKAMRLNLERGRFVYGGSTITQQLVKNLFPLTGQDARQEAERGHYLVANHRDHQPRPHPRAVSKLHRVRPGYLRYRPSRALLLPEGRTESDRQRSDLPIHAQARTVVRKKGH